jgi:hypothetical protein
VGRDSLSLLCGRRRVSGAGKFTGRHKTYGAFRDAPALPKLYCPTPEPAKRPAFNAGISAPELRLSAIIRK